MYQYKRGFTLIELLMVIAIIGILSAIVLASLNGARGNANDARRISDIRQIQYALEVYYTQNNRYPCKIYNDALVTCELAGTSAMPTPPRDPTNVDYAYSALGIGTACSNYHLGASLEKNTHAILRGDKDATSAGTLCTDSLANFSGLSASVGGAACSVTAGTAQPGGTESCYDLTP